MFCLLHMISSNSMYMKKETEWKIFGNNIYGDFWEIAVFLWNDWILSACSKEKTFNAVNLMTKQTQ